tara:strand:+ start:268 stop:534 length:267 start_codon:yes stop_codon:yes gene_type:complete
MGKYDYKLIQRITKDLGLNDGEGYSLVYVKSVLSPINDRKNEEIELIAETLNEASKQATNALLKSFEGLKEEKSFWLKLSVKLNKEAA